MKRSVSILLSVVITAIAAFAILNPVLPCVEAEEYKVYKEEVLLTFDGDAPYGMPANRGASIEYCIGEGYLKLSNKANSGGQSYIGINGTVGKTSVNTSANPGQAAKDAAYADLFKFQAGKTYRLQFDYKYLAGSGGSSRSMDLIVMTNPLNSAADTNYNLSTRTTVLESKPASASWEPVNEALAEDTEWATAYYIFTVSPDDTNGVCVGISPGNHRNYGVSAAIDNLSVKEIASSFVYNESDIHDMSAVDAEPIVGAQCTVSKVTDPEMGEVLKAVGGTAGRIGYDDLHINNGNKYYISFDAKADAEGTVPVFVIGINGAQSSSCRYFIAGFNYNDQGTDIYVDGVKVTAETVKYSTKWQHYGIVIDTNDPELQKKIFSYQSKFWSRDIHFLVGVNGGTAYFDNLRIIEVGSLPDAVVGLDDASPAYSIRAEKKAADNNGVYQSAGLRFRGTVSSSVKDSADEIGVMVVPSSAVLFDNDWYDIEAGVNKMVRSNVWYKKGEKDIVYSDNGDFVSYQLILTGLSNEAGQALYSRRFAAVMYVKSGDAYTYYSLGETSYNEIKANYIVRNVEFGNENKRTDLKILMIGNSFCYYFPDELYEIAKAAGYDLTIANLYYPGCYLKNHWEWLQSDSAKYENFIITDKNGQRDTDIKTLKAALNFTDWDVITLQQHMSLSLMDFTVEDSYDTVWASCDPYAENLYDYIKGNNPASSLYWQETWAFEVGFKGFGYALPTIENQTTQYNYIKKASTAICEQNNVSMIPSGDAWQIARQNPIIGDNLCQYTNKNDKYHDGDLGGGQYLNACVWFEVLMHKSCVGNTWTPTAYNLSAEKISALQNAAHEAVAAVYGYDYAQ